MKKICFLNDVENPVCLKCIESNSLKEKIRGLNGFEKLSQEWGMLFSFRIPFFRCFTVKNMSFPLDIIFLNSKKQVSKIVSNSCCRGFCKYVVETNRGFCKKHNISKGCHMIFL